MTFLHHKTLRGLRYLTVLRVKLSEVTKFYKKNVGGGGGEKFETTCKNILQYETLLKVKLTVRL